MPSVETRRSGDTTQRSGNAARQRIAKGASGGLKRVKNWVMRKPDSGKGKAPKTTKELFDEIDTDGSGILSIDELKALLTNAGGGRPLSEDELQEIVAQFDANGDGQISYSEFLAMWADDVDPTPPPPPPPPPSSIPASVAEAFLVFDKDGSGALSADEMRAVLKRADGGAPLSDKEINKIIEKFDTNGDGELQIEEFSAMWMSGAASDPSKLAANPAARQKAAAAAKGNKAAAGGRSSTSGGKGAGSTRAQTDWRSVLQRYETPGFQPEMLLGAEAQAAEIAAAECLQKRRFATHLTSAYLETAAAGFLMKAQEDESVREKTHSVALRLAEALKSKESLSVDELMREWDPNRDGSITRLEFRVNVRKLVDKGGYSCQMAELYALFNELDVDRGGGISISELKMALKKLEQTTEAARRRAAALQQSAGAFRHLAVQTKQVAAITRLAEKSLDELELATDASKSLVKNSKDTKHSGVGKGSLNKRVSGGGNPGTAAAAKLEGNTAGAQLGALMVRKNMDAEMVVCTWDESGDGLIQMDEFKQELVKIGVTCEAAQIEELFRSLDTDGGGSLDVAEVKLALKTLEAQAFAARQGVRGLSGQTVELMKAMKAAQNEWREQRRAEDAAEAAEAARRRREEAEKAEAAAAALATKEAAAAERAAKAAAEKALADQRIAAKRGKAVAPVAGSKGSAAPTGGSLVTRSKLKLRAGAPLDSPDAGDVKAGTRVRVMARETLADGTQRARIALEGEKTSLGWVSCLSREGLPNLVDHDLLA